MHAVFDRRNTAAARVATHNDVCNFEMHNAVFENGGHIDVVEGYDVGDVAMHKHRAGPGRCNDVFAHPRIGATNPEHCGRLPIGNRLIIFFIWLKFTGNELTVALEQLIDHDSFSLGIVTDFQCGNNLLDSSTTAYTTPMAAVFGLACS